MVSRLRLARFLFFIFSLLVANNVYADLQVSPTTLTIKVGATAKITVTGSTGTVTTKSSNITVATVSYATGAATVKGLAVGQAKITIKDRKKSRSVAVKVISAATPGMTITPGSLSLTKGTTRTLTVANANGTVTATSANPAVATASYANNKVTVNAISVGSTTLLIKDSRTTLTVPVAVVAGVVVPPAAGNYTLLAWNDLGMHCMDGIDFSVFSILPPYNTLHAQLKNKSGGLVSSGVKLTYEAVPDSTGSINTISHTKTNFWDWSGRLLGLNLPIDVGVNLDGIATGNPEPGNETPSLTPAPLTYNAEFKWFEAEGLPITPIDDTGKKNFYPTVKVVAKDTAGNVLASTTTVLPVSDEMTCSGCHASTTSVNPAQIAAKPAAGWVNDANKEKDWKRNILRLHDERKLPLALYKSALTQVGYNANGLLATADSGKPVLCVSCHASNAYFDKKNKTSIMKGLTGIRAFTQVLHLKHGQVKDPATQQPLDSNGDRTACYLCHPGSKTQCLRGAMGKAKDASGNSQMSCQSCHGNMKAVGSPTRHGWIDEPTCESCHNSNAPNRRAVSGVGNPANGDPIVPADHRFASNANAPAIPGLTPNLYRFSTGHGGLQCEACHGATHAEYPSLHADDNTQSIAVQGHAGTVAECTACHKTMPVTVNGGPHGMHTTGNAWVKAHEDAVEDNPAALAGCTYCHGTTAAGTPLSAIKVAKTINADEFGTKNWPAGYQVSCFSCHNGPNPD